MIILKLGRLRCVNNNIKHNGIVFHELVAANLKWTLDQSISNTYDDFRRLMDGPGNLLGDVINEINDSIA